MDYYYRPRRQPPHKADRVLVRPFEHLGTALNMVFGTVLICEAVLPGEMIGVYLLSPLVYLVLGAFLACGGGAALCGLQWPRTHMSVGWAVERCGWLASAAGWAGVCLVITMMSPFMVFGFLISLYMFTCSALRFVLLQTVERKTRATVEGAP